MADRSTKVSSVTARLSARHAQLLGRVTDQRRDPYAPSKTSVIERGIELAVRELERGREYRRRHRGPGRERDIPDLGEGE